LILLVKITVSKHIAANGYQRTWSELKNIGRVIGIYGPRVEICADDNIISSSVSGKLKFGESGQSVVAVGDLVEFSLKNEDQAAIDKILQRKSVISRPAVVNDGTLQIIVSNVDRIVIVTSTTRPQFRPGAVDRLLVIAIKEGIHPLVVINKSDLADPSSFQEFADAWHKIGCDVFFTSALTGDHVEKLSRALQEGISVVVGHSGVGKSSILNMINPEFRLKTGKISSYSGRGIHTTSRVNLYRISQDGWIADTPGLRELGLAGVTRQNLHLFYPEFELLESQCQYRDCLHVDEPSCAVKAALENNDPNVPAFRYKGYVNIYQTLPKKS
jgi:ribosome biogenesis GTPase